MNKISHKEAVLMISETKVWPRKAMFVAILAENVLPCYEFFHQSENWGNPNILRESVSLLYESVFTSPYDLKEEALMCQENINVVMPDLDDFAGISASYGFDSCIVIDEALNFLATQSGIYVERVVNAVFNTLDMYIQEKENLDSQDPKLENKIANDPIMLHEMKRQMSLITYINDHIGEKTSQSDYLECRKVNLSFGQMIDFNLLSN